MKVAISWSGGMESCLACHRVLSQDYDVACLVTFVLDSWPSICHPLSIMRLQSKSIDIPHIKVKVKEPYREGYRKAISHLHACLKNDHQFPETIRAARAMVQHFNSRSEFRKILQHVGLA